MPLICLVESMNDEWLYIGWNVTYHLFLWIVKDSDP